MTKKDIVWVMPAWMEPYRDFIVNTGGNSVEDLEGDRTTSSFSNMPRAMLCVAVKSQVMLLTKLHEKGLLK